MRQEPDGFDAFWGFWREHKRHTDGRGKCRKEYQRQLNDGATPDDILLAAHWHVRNTKDLAFIPLAATWLNSEAWVDECEKERRLKSSRASERQSSPTNVTPIRAPQSAFLREFEQRKAQGV